LLLILVETRWDHPFTEGFTRWAPGSLSDCQNSIDAIMSCARVVPERILAGSQGLIRSKKQKATSKDGLIACYA
jgi:hypothetical protein